MAFSTGLLATCEPVPSRCNSMQFQDFSPCNSHWDAARFVSFSQGNLGDCVRPSEMNSNGFFRRREAHEYFRRIPVHVSWPRMAHQTQCRYKPKMLMDFIKMNVQKLNIPKLIHACERHYHWEHAVFLYTHYDEYDQAANTMMAHSPIAFAHDQFLMIMQKVSNMELYYRAVQFYLDEQPLQLNSLLSTITPKVDHARVVQQVKKAGQLPLIMPYMKQVQQHNIAPVNEAINDIYVDGVDDLSTIVTHHVLLNDEFPAKYSRPTRPTRLGTRREFSQNQACGLVCAALP
eukprot:s4281_g5.t1